jgi:hypothetical protein
MKNGIETGISKSNFLGKFDFINGENCDKIKLIEINSSFMNVFHTYTFDEKDILKKIEIKTRDEYDSEKW